MAGQKGGHGFLIFRGVIGAGGIHQPAAGAQQLRRPVQNAGLTSGAAGGGIGLPLGAGIRLPAEHAFPGTGRVHQHRVEKARPLPGQFFGIFVDDDGVGNPQPLQIARQHLRPFGLGFVGDQKALAPQSRRQLGGLAPGGGAQIQHPLARAHVQKGGGEHGGGLLHVKSPAEMGKPRPGPGSGQKIIAVFRPGHGIPGEQGPQFSGGGPGGIHPQGQGRRGLQRRAEGRGFRPQKGFHLGHKGRIQGRAGPFRGGHYRHLSTRP